VKKFLYIIEIIVCVFLFTGCRVKSTEEREAQTAPIEHFRSEDEQYFWTQAYTTRMIRGGALHPEREAETADKMLLEYRKRK
jgi:hypothetical protein